MLLWAVPAWALDAVRDRVWEGEPGDRFASALARAADYDGDGFDDVAFGARDVSQGAGAVWVHRGGPSGPAPVPAVVLHGASGDRVGAGLDAGDIDGDGLPDLVVLSRRTGDGTNAGEVCVHPSGMGGPSPVPGSCIDGSAIPSGLETDAVGVLLAVTSDLDGDGFEDVVVRPDEAVEGEGGWVQAWVLHGGPAGLDPGRLHPLATLDFAGNAGGLSGGDLDGDGLAEVVVGNYAVDEVNVFPGTPDGPAAEPITFTGIGYFGRSVAVVGDLDGDGYADLAVGASSAGVVHLYRGGAGGPVASATMTVGQDWALFGASVAAAGDVDGDGHADLVVGGPGIDTAYLWFGAPGGPVDEESRNLVHTGFWGELVGGAGDVDRDGLSDLLVVGRYDEDEGGEVALYLAGAPSCADERCNGVDDDCDGEVDEDAIDLAQWAPDSDGDGHPGGGFVVEACDAPPGYVPAGDAVDCDDADASRPEERACVDGPPRADDRGCTTGPPTPLAACVALLALRRRR